MEVMFQMDKMISVQQAVDLIPDGATLMVGGFLGCGSPQKILEALSLSGKKNFTLIVNDGGLIGGPDGSEYYGVAKLIHNKQIKKLYASHVGLNPEIAEQMHDGSMEVVLVPQGSLAEMIRAGGAGMGGILTPTGLGTIVQDAEHVVQTIEVDGKTYLLERPLHADVALLGGSKVDHKGNIWYRGTTKNFNVVMATAADLVIAEAEEVVEVGAIEPENVATFGVFVNHIVDGGKA